jgi:WD40 repeat protein
MNRVPVRRLLTGTFILLAALLPLRLRANPVPVDTASRPPLLRATFSKLRLVSSASVSPDGKLIAAGSWPRDGEGLVRWWDWPGGKERPPLRGPTNHLKCTAISPDGHLVAAAGREKIVWVWDAGTGKLLHKLEGHDESVHGLSFSPDGRLLASVSISDETAIILWDPAAGKKVSRLALPQDTGAYSVAFSPDGRLLASGGWDGMVRLWDPAAGKELAALKGHGPTVRKDAFAPGQKPLYTVHAVVFTNDGKLLISGGDDGTVRFWDVAARKEVEKLVYNPDTVHSLAVSPDGRWLAVGGTNGKLPDAVGEVQIYNLASRREATRFIAHNYPVRTVKFFGPDGAWLLTSGTENTEEEDKPDEGTVKVWQLRLPAVP